MYENKHEAIRYVKRKIKTYLEFLKDLQGENTQVQKYFAELDFRAYKLLLDELEGKK